jgi:hypothetical protein
MQNGVDSAASRKEKAAQPSAIRHRWFNGWCH